MSVGLVTCQPFEPSTGDSVCVVVGASVSAAPTLKYSKSTSIGAACAGPNAIRPIAGLFRATVTEPGACTQSVPFALIAPV